MHTPFDTELPNLTSQHTWGGGLFLKGQSRGGVPALLNFWSSLLFMRSPFIAELPNLT